MPRIGSEPAHVSVRVTPSATSTLDGILVDAVNAASSIDRQVATLELVLFGDSRPPQPECVEEAVCVSIQEQCLSLREMNQVTRDRLAKIIDRLRHNQ